jgi:hypothetical protein
VTWAEPGNPQLTIFSRIGVAFDVLPLELESLLSKKERRAVRK